MFTETIDGYTLCFETDDTIFSPGKIDTGTRAMLSQAAFRAGDKVLDLGCGYGPVGIYAAQIVGAQNVILCDLLPQAVALSRQNALRNGAESLRIVQSDGFENLTDRDFTIILSNPPYHADFSVARRFH